MARQRNYRAEYEARKAKAQTEGFTGYGSARGFRARQLKDIMTNDIAFTHMPIERQTRANALRYQKAFYYLGVSTPEQLKQRRKFVKDMQGDLDTGVWSDYYKDVIYPALTGTNFPGWTPIVTNGPPMTVADWEQTMRQERADANELDEEE